MRSMSMRVTTVQVCTHAMCEFAAYQSTNRNVLH
jgi:hypothetical protein